MSLFIGLMVDWLVAGGGGFKVQECPASRDLKIHGLAVIQRFKVHGSLIC
jgi:hypothetical protein